MAVPSPHKNSGIKVLGRRMLRFTELELQHIGISVLVLAFALSGIGFTPLEEVPLQLIVVAVPLAAGFLAHELAHKYAAGTYGYFSVYRMWPIGLLMGLVIGLASGGKFLFLAPGAVVILAPFFTVRQSGVIAISGPLTNIALAAAFYPLVHLPGWIGLMGFWGARVNLWLAFFNLLPFPPLDGAKVFLWKPVVWVIVEASLLIPMVLM
jgi:Zn-dependent protease